MCCNGRSDVKNVRFTRQLTKNSFCLLIGGLGFSFTVMVIPSLAYDLMNVGRAKSDQQVLSTRLGPIKGRIFRPA